MAGTMNPVLQVKKTHKKNKGAKSINQSNIK